MSRTVAAPGQMTYYHGGALVIQENTLLPIQYRKVVQLKQRAVQEEINRNVANPMESETDRIKWAIAVVTSQYGINPQKILDTNKCESGLRHQNVVGDSGKAYGTAQFHYPTFQRFCNGNYYDMNDQIVCQVKMFVDGLSSHWSCAK